MEGLRNPRGILQVAATSSIIPWPLSACNQRMARLRENLFGHALSNRLARYSTSRKA